MDDLENLKELVSINSVSPIDEKSIVLIDRFLEKYNFQRNNNHTFWYRGEPTSRICVYSHIDTKPPIPAKEWKTDPFLLVQQDKKLYGLGISDAKFQLLNAIEIFNNESFFFIIDGDEETGNSHCGDTINQNGFEYLLIVDGSMECGSSHQIFSGTKGQVDGWIKFDSGCSPLHPSRRPQSMVLDYFRNLHDFIHTYNLQFNITEVTSPKHIRSLTVEQTKIKFDIRFLPEEEKNINLFINTYKPKIRQFYKPLIGIKTRTEFPVASFTIPISNLISTFENVFILPGGIPENGNHGPNEWIYIEQIEKHKKLLSDQLLILTIC